MKNKSQVEWKTILRDQEASGQSASAYCRAQGINIKTFSNQKRKCHQQPIESGFIPVAIQGDNMPPPKKPGLILKHRNSILDFAELPASEWLAQLLLNANA